MADEVVSEVLGGRIQGGPGDHILRGHGQRGLDDVKRASPVRRAKRITFALAITLRDRGVATR